MMRILLFILCFFSHLTLNAGKHAPAESRPHLILNSLWGMGFFEDFLTVIGALQLYKLHVVSGVDVDYGSGGTYFDASVGENWWEYYFEPIKVGNLKGSHLTTVHSIEIDGINYDLPRMTEFHLPRQMVHETIKKYIHVKPHIENKVNQIVANSFKNHTIIGVHYRGTENIRKTH